MQWRDRGIVLGLRRQGENAAIIRIFTQNHGLYGGWIYALSRKNGTYQPGNRVMAVWRSRLSEHLGTFRCELEDSPVGRILHRSERLVALMSCCSLAELCFAERAPDPHAYDDLSHFMDALEGENWAAACVHWEVALLSRMGFGLDLKRCTVSGSLDIRYVSPKSGRGVSENAAAGWRDKLLPLPPFLRPGSDPQAAVSDGDIASGLRLCGFFLERHIHKQKLPAARHYLAEAFSAPYEGEKSNYIEQSPMNTPMDTSTDAPMNTSMDTSTDNGKELTDLGDMEDLGSEGGLVGEGGLVSEEERDIQES